ncbi:immune inhibitor A domain-containing protein [Paenibacillus alkalitolerans]|uniref:immune inhibitor A domain-containing protein n=1 Tax=Paenibacillus alkalitolerans TaxID=2799335 RepID=UPI0018F3D663|nr:immune inhibitor A domain-containing protein [Paenibacillus alkalitolerans]
MKSKKLLSATMVLALGIGSIGSASFSPALASLQGSAQSQSPHSYTDAFDMGVANDDKLIQMLKKNGTIPPNASAATAEAALHSFLRAKSAAAATQEKGELHKHELKREQALKQNLLNDGLFNGSGNKLGQTKKNGVDPAQEAAWTGGKRTDKVLVLLIDYPDFPHNSIQPDETDMYYKDYVKQHYDDMVFGSNGYTGPNGERLVSVKQYYESQSGGSYSIEGQVAGWYMASKPAAEYGANVPAPDGNDKDARGLVREALLAAAKDPTLNLNEYDKEDRYDLDGDGNYREADGLIDHLMIVHSSVGEEAGGGSLGGDAVWSHRWNLGGVFTLPGTSADVGYWNGRLAAYDYTMQPADGAAGVFAHEFGHDLGLPDEYDTIYSGQGEAVEYWSIMSSGSWAGAIPGTEPTGFSAWSKEFLQANVGGNWLSGTAIHVDDIPASGVEVLLDQAVTKGQNNDAVRIDLPMKQLQINTPYSGQFEYFSGKGDEVDHSMVATLDLTSAASASLSFKTWYQIEQDWDYASIQVREPGGSWMAIPGNLTTTDDPYQQNPGHGITGHSDGWVDAQFDLSAYAGKSIELRFNYWTDVAVSEAGFYVDDISIAADGSTVLFDNAEETPKFALEGFTVDKGTIYAEHYYLLEWRNHAGVDAGLAHIRRGASLMSYDAGLLVWYVDNSYDNNWTGIHPGEGFLGLVDADQKGVMWSDRIVASSRFQLHDAAFGLAKTAKMDIDYTALYGATIKDNSTAMNPILDDSQSYLNPDLPDAGRNIPQYGLKIRVIGEASDRSAAKVLLHK